MVDSSTASAFRVYPIATQKQAAQDGSMEQFIRWARGQESGLSYSPGKVICHIKEIIVVLCDCHLSSVQKWSSWYCLIFIMGISTLARLNLHIQTTLLRFTDTYLKAISQDLEIHQPSVIKIKFKIAHLKIQLNYSMILAWWVITSHSISGFDYSSMLPMLV